MKQSLKKIAVLFGIIFFIFVSLVFFETREESSVEKQDGFFVEKNDLYHISNGKKNKVEGFEETKDILKDYKKKFIEINNKIYELSVAEGVEKMMKGLSGTKLLLQNTGMLFVFDTEDFWGFWMKEMNFPIDIVWLSSDCEVVGIQNASPESYPEVFYPKAQAKYVLEFVSREVGPYIKEGDTLECKGF